MCGAAKFLSFWVWMMSLSLIFNFNAANCWIATRLINICFVYTQIWYRALIQRTTLPQITLSSVLCRTCRYLGGLTSCVYTRESVQRIKSCVVIWFPRLPLLIILVLRPQILSVPPKALSFYTQNALSRHHHHKMNHHDSANSQLHQPYLIFLQRNLTKQSIAILS